MMFKTPEIELIDEIYSRSDIINKNIIVAVHPVPTQREKILIARYEKLQKKYNFQFQYLYLDQKMTTDAEFQAELSTIVHKIMDSIINFDKHNPMIIVTSPFILNYVPTDLMKDNPHIQLKLK